MDGICLLDVRITSGASTKTFVQTGKRSGRRTRKRLAWSNDSGRESRTDLLSVGMGDVYKDRKNSVTISELYKQQMDKAPIGSYWAVLRADPWTQKTLETGLNPELAAKALNALQKYAVENTRLGIPVLLQRNVRMVIWQSVLLHSQLL